MSNNKYLESAKKIREEEGVRKEKWKMMFGIPLLLLLIGLIFDWQNWEFIIYIFLFNFIAFWYRLWTWEIANKPLELLVIVASAVLLIAMLIFLYSNNQFSLGTIPLLLGAFYTSVFSWRALFANKVNQTIHKLEKR